MTLRGDAGGRRIVVSTNPMHRAKNNMSARLKWLTAIALLAGPAVAPADSVITYSFSGYILGGSGAYIPIAPGTPVTGTFTIDFGAGSTIGTVGSTTSDWIVQAQAGTVYGTQGLTTPVFTSTLQFAGNSYGPSSPSPLGSASYVSAADTNSLGVENAWQTMDTEYSTLTAYATNEINFYSSRAPFDANGLPVFANVTSQFDRLVNSDGTGIQYVINSLTPVPLPASAWLMLSSLGGLGFLARRRQRGCPHSWWNES